MVEVIKVLTMNSLQAMVPQMPLSTDEEYVDYHNFEYLVFLV